LVATLEKEQGCRNSAAVPLFLLLAGSYSYNMICYLQSCTLQDTCTSRGTEGAAGFAERRTPRPCRHAKSQGPGPRMARSSIQPITRRSDGLSTPRPLRCTRPGRRPRGGPRLCCRQNICTDNGVLAVQVPPSPGKQAAILRTLQSSDLLRQAVCASGLGET
jgi:hypothetical protein